MLQPNQPKYRVTDAGNPILRTTVTEEFRLKLPSFRQHRWVNHKSHMHFLNNSFGVRLNRSTNSMEQGPSWEANSSSAS